MIATLCDYDLIPFVHKYSRSYMKTITIVQRYLLSYYLLLLVCKSVSKLSKCLAVSCDSFEIRWAEIPVSNAFANLNYQSICSSGYLMIC